MFLFNDAFKTFYLLLYGVGLIKKISVHSQITKKKQKQKQTNPPKKLHTKQTNIRNVLTDLTIFLLQIFYYGRLDTNKPCHVVAHCGCALQRGQVRSTEYTSGFN